jgi:hypothetical protein
MATIGNTSIAGVGFEAWTPQVLLWGPFAGAEGTLTAGYLYSKYVTSVVNGKIGLFLDVAGSPTDSVCIIEIVPSSTTGAWNTAAASGAIHLGTNYWVAFLGNSATNILTGELSVAGGKYCTSASYAAFAHPWTVGALTSYSKEPCVYFDYTPAGGTDVSVSPDLEVGFSAQKTPTIVTEINDCILWIPHTSRKMIFS